MRMAHLCSRFSNSFARNGNCTQERERERELIKAYIMQERVSSPSLKPCLQVHNSMQERAANHSLKLCLQVHNSMQERAENHSLKPCYKYIIVCKRELRIIR
jgi:hypothetical protein